MIITVLVENTTCRPDLIPEHGLSLYIETETARILFDAGQSDAFSQNATQLGVDLRQVDFAVLSHGHYDHGGGFAHFLALNPHAPVYLRREAPEPHFNASGRNIGLDTNQLPVDRLIFTPDTVEIAPGIRLVSGADMPLLRPVDTAGMTFRSQGIPCPEDFRHEQYLFIEEAEKTVCISGCSHRGILNIASHFRPDVMVGGFHFMKLDPADPLLAESARCLLELPTVYYTGHCTGLPQYNVLKTHMGHRLNPLSTGTIIHI